MVISALATAAVTLGFAADFDGSGKTAPSPNRQTIPFMWQLQPNGTQAIGQWQGRDSDAYRADAVAVSHPHPTSGGSYFQVRLYSRAGDAVADFKSSIDRTEDKPDLDRLKRRAEHVLWMMANPTKAWEKFESERRFMEMLGEYPLQWWRWRPASTRRELYHRDRPDVVIGIVQGTPQGRYFELELANLDTRWRDHGVGAHLIELEAQRLVEMLAYLQWVAAPQGAW